MIGTEWGGVVVVATLVVMAVVVLAGLGAIVLAVVFHPPDVSDLEELPPTWRADQDRLDARKATVPR